MYTYLLIDVLTPLIPIVFSFHPRLRFYRTGYALWPAVLLTATLFLVWDIYFTAWGVWGFNPHYLLGIDWFGLPVEEWMFFICIPYACMFTYASLKTLLKKNFLARYTKAISWGIIVGLSGVLLFNFQHLYTAVTFSSTIIFLIWLMRTDADFLGPFYISYTLIFAMPFLLVNGVLTGSFIAEEVVWYNDAENLGIRVFTIPVEDFVYGFLLFLMNVTLYEEFIRRHDAKTPDLQSA